jgi:pilus assembly protein CpaB
MKRLAPLLCSLSAIATFGLGYLYTERLEAEVSGGPRVSVLVAAQDIPVSAVIAEKHLAVRDIPRAYVESRHVLASDLKKVLGQRATGGLKVNEALLSTDLSKFAERRSLSGLVSNGMRALAIDGRAADFDGLLRPGDRVDVLLSLGTSNETAGATITLLQNLLVLSVGGTTLRNDGNEKSYSRGSTVTVSVTAEQAQVLTEAMRRGKLTLSLRNGEDVTLIEGIAETSARDLITRSVASPRPASTPVGSAKEGPSHVR